MVSRDVALLKNEFEKRTAELSGKIEAETKSLTAKLDETKTSILDKVGVLFARRFIKAASIIIGAIPLMYAGVIFLQTKTVLSQVQIAYIAGLTGAVTIFITWMLTRKT